MTNLTYVFLQKNSHITEGDKTACGLAIPANAERTEQGNNAALPHDADAGIDGAVSELVEDSEGRFGIRFCYDDDSESSP